MFLLVDDEVAALLRLKKMMTQAGVSSRHIMMTHKPAEALALVKAHEFSAVFLDVEMPESDGFSLLYSFRKQGFDGKVIFTTSHDKYAIQALRKKALDFLQKPVIQEELEAALNRIKSSENIEEKDFSKLSAYGLTERQINIVKMIFNGMTSSEIGEKLFLSKHTIDTHRRNILRKTRCSNTAELYKLF
ncbi:MAG: response regulator transcription factor [Cryomorphaceae bacterium]|nr:response regulator transcription factor [Cryomorphaceae bacterium]